MPPGPVGSIDSLVAFAERAPVRPAEWGVLWNPATDPDRRRPALYLIAADSTVWVEDPDGRAVSLDPWLVSMLGENVDERTGQAEERGRRNTYGYGYEDGRVYVYLRQGGTFVAAAAAALAAVLAVAALAVWLGRRLRRERRQRALLDLAYRRHAEAREDERLRIAQDLHDGPVQDLNLVNLRLAALDAGVGGDGTPGAVADVRAEVVAVARGLRAVAEALRPPALGPFGLAAALRLHADRVAALHPGVRVTCDADDDRQTLPEGVRLALFRVAQEALTNAVKHGPPTTVRVALRLEGDTVDLSVADDGPGFAAPDDPAALAADGHLGLAGMAERARALGGRLRVESAPGAGTTVRVRARRDAPEWAAPALHHPV